MKTTGTLVLFDIDGTLIQTGVGIRGMGAAFAHLHQRPDALEHVSIAGRTDRSIVTDALTRIGLAPSPEAIAAVRTAYLDHLPVEMARRVDGRGILPGVVELLDALEARPSTMMGLLTGNFAPAAAIKLGHYDLWRRFRLGAFGDDHLNRRDLVPVAVAAAEGAGFSPSRVIVIGDTPLDVDCARAHGALAVAVTTGIYTREALESAGAHVTVETLADLAADGEWLGR